MFKYFTTEEDIKQYKNEIQMCLTVFREKISNVDVSKYEDDMYSNMIFAGNKLKIEAALESFISTLTISNCFVYDCFEEMKKVIEKFDCNNPLPDLLLLSGIIEKYSTNDKKKIKKEIEYLSKKVRIINRQVRKKHFLEGRFVKIINL